MLEFSGLEISRFSAPFINPAYRPVFFVGSQEAFCLKRLDKTELLTSK
jgi:hypothetical protein